MHQVFLVYAPALVPEAGDVLDPPLGLVYLATVLTQHGISVRIFDLQHHRTSWGALEDAIAATDRCLVGFTCYSNNIFRVLRLSDRLLGRFPGVPVVLGGPHVMHVWEPYLGANRLVVRGEGEYPLLLLAKHFLLGEGALEDIPGIAYLADDKVRLNPSSSGIFADVDQIPFPDLSLLPAFEEYTPSVITARGCPYSCRFCSQGSQAVPFRPRSARNVAEELRNLKRLLGSRLNFISFLDDTFTYSYRRVVEMCEVLEDVFSDCPSFAFFCEGRVNVLSRHPELIHRLKRAGLCRLQIGIESGNQDTLDRVGKRTRATEIEGVVKVAHEAGVSSLFGCFMICLPGQTLEELHQDLEFAKRLADLAPGRMQYSVSALAPMPGTEFRINAPHWGIRILDEDFVTGNMTGMTPFCETDSLSFREAEAFAVRFTEEIRSYLIHQGAERVSSHQLKEQLAFAADHCDRRPFLLDTLLAFAHVRRVYFLRHRPDHRLLYELPRKEGLECAPLLIGYPLPRGTDGSAEVNEGSAMPLVLDQAEMRYAKYFAGKLSLRAIAVKVALADGIDERLALATCEAVYLKCEDHFAAMLVV